MGIFRRRGRKDEQSARDERPAENEDEAPDADADPDEEIAAAGEDGPFDLEDAPDDQVPRLDLGSVRVPVPDGAQLQVEMDPSGPVRAVHVVTPVGQITISAYAAPRTGGLWYEVRSELAEQLNGDGAQVESRRGEWGAELAAALGKVSLRFVGVDGPRWMLRGVIAGPPEQAEEAVGLLRTVVRGTVVVRGPDPMPVRTPLSIKLPEAIAEHVQQAQGNQSGG
ncbi:uncharacterized protein DUF3710 [Tamaricihabitans halophyticus]|uniref:Uncharacterized protein DUF3710 n=1 Tax=Tamaricihabitans halophyticus TaxID=1262583 RepID=A0A4R2QYB5_9PSEU|nr:DUF3710 domain-containing protein [Tamaricihabitans halophyticus]TCP55222.1 uncharacterized protein DUF3710 [Tamaricihabitans halophyticus]